MTRQFVSFTAKDDLFVKQVIERTSFAIDKLKTKIRHHEEQLAWAEAELNARDLAAYWAANPQLTAVNVGDELLTTQSFTECKRGVYDYMPNDWFPGVRCSLLSIWINRRVGSVEFTTGGFTGGVPLEVLSDMRKRYLESEKTI